MRDWSTDDLLAQLYDWEHDAFQDDVDFYAALATRTGGPALELACGTGRVLEGLARTGLMVTGVDRSAAMLRRARARLAPWGQAIRLVESDVLGSWPDGPYALIVLALDALGLVEDRAAQQVLLGRVRAALRPGGLVGLDLVQPMALADQPQGIPVLQASGPDEEIDAHATKWMVRRLHPATQSVELHSFFDLVWADGSYRRLTDVLHLSYFGPREVAGLLEGAGFTVDGIYGDYELGLLRDESERIVIIATAGGSGGD